ncbi:MAG: CoA transferase [Rhodobacterales bacterium]|nr:CoA transferase [Rhodobacterales bacterium]
MTQVEVGALQGLRVVDMTRVIAGPLATQTLGDLGAEVIKIERRGEGDDVRRIGPPWMKDRDGNDTTESTYFRAANRNKKSLTVDFTQPDGVRLLQDLVRQSDILVENYRPGTLSKYGLGPDDLLKINPGLIYCSISGFGQDGPYAGRSGYDYLAQAMAGAMNVTGQPDGVAGAVPMRVGIPMADIFAGLQATIGILAAVNHRHATGVGQHIDVSLFDAQFAAMLNPASAWLNSRVEIGRTGNDHPSAAPYGVFPTDDGHILIATFNDREFIRLAAALGHPEWSSDPRFSQNGARVENRELLRDLVTKALRGRSKAEWVAVLNAATVSCGPINTIRDLEDDPHVIARRMIQSVAHPTHGPVRFAASPIRLSATPVSYRSAPPDIGENTHEVLRDVLGLGDEQVRALQDRGVV